MRMKHLLEQCGRYSLYGLAGWVLTGPLSSQAVTNTVSVQNFQFSPSAVTINVNDSVKWSWVSGTHNTTSTSVPKVWASSTMGSGSFTFTFPAAGNFPYTCTLHTSLGMNGSVTVTGGNVPPSVAITSPTNGSTFTAPWTGTINATASDADGTVTKVDFFAGTTRLGTVSNPPANLSFTVTNLAAGSYTLKAVATDNGGATNSSAGVNINVVASASIVLSSPQRVSASAFQFSYAATAGMDYVVLRSDTLPGLLPISTNRATSSTVTFTDNNATGAVNFYEVRLAP